VMRLNVWSSGFIIMIIDLFFICFNCWILFSNDFLGMYCFFLIVLFMRRR